MTTDTMTDEQFNIEIAKALGIERIDEKIGMFVNGNPIIPDFCGSADAALELVEAMEKRGFDVIIRRHNSGQWECEFTEPSHEIRRYGDTLPKAISLAFFAAQKEQL